MYEYFTAVPRVPLWNPAKFGAKVERSHYRYFKWHLDFANAAHINELSSIVTVLAQKDRENQVQCRLLLEKFGVLPVVEEFCADRPDEAMKPDFVDLFYLYSHILESRPKVVLELGSGISTAVMAAALQHNGEGRLYSVDPNQEWAESTAQSLPGGLKDWCEVTYSEGRPVKIEVLDEEGISSIFETLPVGHADMIYLDAAHEDASLQGAETIHAMRPRFKGGETILIDGRWKAIEFFCREPDLYDVTAYANIVVSNVIGGSIVSLDMYTNTIVTVRPPAHG